MKKILFTNSKPTNPSKSTYWFIFYEQKLLANLENKDCPIFCALDIESLDVLPSNTHFLGYLDDKPCYVAAVISDQNIPNGFEFFGLRYAFFQFTDVFVTFASRAIQILNWDREHQFCGRCGGKMHQKLDEHAKACPDCQLVNFPRISPAIIVLVYRGEEMLLGRGVSFPDGMYSTLAGFVEAGETIEDTVKREVFEESNIHVHNIQYFGSQPWPFPNSLMLGFFAEYKSGEIKIDPHELVDAQWFSKNNLPPKPSTKISIAGQLIHQFLEYGVPVL